LVEPAVDLVDDAGLPECLLPQAVNKTAVKAKTKKCVFMPSN